MWEISSCQNVLVGSDWHVLPKEAEAAAEAQRKAELARVKAAKQSGPQRGHGGFLVNLQVLRISIRMDGVFTWHGVYLAFLMGMWEKERHFSLNISAVHHSSEAPKEPKATEADHRELLCRNPSVCF